MKTPGRRIAATVTRGAVRCCARLGFLFAAEPAEQKVRKAMRLADDRRIGGLGKLAGTERMELTRDESPRPVENCRGTGRGRMELAGGAEREESGAELAAGVAREGSDWKATRNWEQAGERRGIGGLGVRKRAAWESSSAWLAGQTLKVT